MKTKTKSTLIIIATLLLGMVLGAITATTYTYQRIERLHSMMEPGRFGPFVVDHIIQPVDDRQRDQLLMIVRTHGQEMHSSLITFRSEMDIRMDSLMAELKPVLTDEQYKRFIDHLETGKRRGGPPHMRGKHQHWKQDQAVEQ